MFYSLASCVNMMPSSSDCGSCGPTMVAPSAPVQKSHAAVALAAVPSLEAIAMDRSSLSQQRRMSMTIIILPAISECADYVYTMHRSND